MSAPHWPSLPGRIRSRLTAAARTRTSALREAGDRGSGAGAVILFTLVFLSLTAFVVDGGLAISQRERAADIAEEAARYAAQDLDEEALRDGESEYEAPINYQNCGARVAKFAAESGLSGGDLAASGCTGATAEYVEVEIQLTYSPIFSSIGGGAVTVHGEARAEPRVEAGNP